MGMKRLHRRSDLKRTGFSAGGENPRSIGFILREIVFSGSHRRRKGRVVAIYRDLQVVGECYRLVGGEGGIRTLGTGYPVRQISNLVPSTTRPPLRARST